MRFRRLEPRRVLDASFAFDGTAALLLNNFNDATGTTALDVSFDSGTNEYVFTLDGGDWIGVDSAGVVGNGTAELRVERALFLDPGDAFDLDITDNLDIGLNVTLSGGDPILFANSPNNGSILIDAGGSVAISTETQTFGNSFSIIAGGNITSSALISTQDLADSGLESGSISFTSTGGSINLGALDSSGADHAGAGALASNAGSISLSTFTGLITVSSIDASGGNATGGGGSVGGNGASISIAATGGNVVIGGALTTEGGSGDSAGISANIVISTNQDIAINQALNSGGGAIDLDATGNITSNVNGSITSTSNQADGTSGLIEIDAGGQVNLAASVSTAGNAINGDANNILITTVNGSINVVALDASGLGTGAGGDVSLDANGVNADITLGGAVLTNGTGAVNLSAQDAIVFNAAGNINAAGTGNVSVTANAIDTGGDSGAGINMVAGSFINAGTGTVASGLILLQSTGTNGGSIVAQQLTTRSNSIQINSGAAINLQQALASGGGAVDLDAVTTITSSVTGTITTTAAANSGAASGSLTINAGTSIDLDGNLVTAGANHNAAGATASSAGLVTIATVDGAIELAGIDASGGDATGGAGSTGGNAAFVSITVGDDAADELHNLTLSGALVTTAGTGTTAGSAADVELTSDNDLAINAAINSQNVRLVALGNVSQTAAGVITADGLAVEANGTATLGEANNVATLAVQDVLSLVFTTGLDLTIDSVTVNGNTVDNVTAVNDVTITALSIIDGDSLPDGPAADITGDNVTLTATGGSIGVAGDIFQGIVNPLEIQATGDLVASATVAIAVNANVVGTVTLTSPSLVLISDGVLNIDDLVVAEDLRIEAADVVANDGSIDITANRMLFISGAAETINTTVGILDVRTSGNLTINSTIAVELLDLDGDNVALATTTNDGSITVTAPGTITVSDDVIAGLDATTTSTGSITLTANGAASDLIINDVVLTDTGDIELSADNDVRIGDVATLSPNDNLVAPNDDDLFLVTTTTGNITIAADADIDGGGELFMGNNARVIAGRDATTDYDPNSGGLASTSIINLRGSSLGSGLAEIEMSAAETVTLGSVQSANNTLDAVRITSRDAAILDGGDAEVDIIANFAGGLVTLRAATGIGSTDGIETSAHALDALNSGSGALWIAEVAAGGDLNLVHASNAGLIRVTVADGSLFVVDNTFTPNNGSFGVTTVGGNIALQASEDIVVDSSISSNTGHIGLIAGDDIFVNTSITTAGSGSLYLQADNANSSDVPVDRFDGINVRATLQTANGDILLRSLADIHVFEVITSTAGDIGLDAAGDVLQDANLIATAGNVLVIAGGDYTMNSAVSVQATNGNIVADVTGDISLAEMTAINVGLEAGGNITDVNGGGVTNVSATNLSMLAGGSIGSSDLGSPVGVNNNAIDTAVDVVEASATTGIYIDDVDDLIIGSVADITVAVAILRDDGLGGTLNESETATIIVAAGLSTAGGAGPVKVVAAGELTVDAAVNTGAGDILLQSTADIIVNAAVASVSGNITIDAADDIDINAAVSTGGSGDVVLLAGNVNPLDAIPAHVDGITIGGTITSGSGELFILSATGLQVDAAISSTGGNIGLLAQDDIALNSSVASTSGSVLVSSTTLVTMAAASTITTAGDVILVSNGDLSLASVAGGRVALQSIAGSILDVNGTALNVAATELSMRAAGSIGGADLGSPVNVNDNAIDVQVGTLAAVAAAGIYILEANGVIVDEVGDASVDLSGVVQVNFNSSTTALDDASVTLNELSDLTSTGGPIKLVATTGNITINDGGDGDEVGVEVVGSGDVLLEARDGSLITTTGVVSDGGHLTLLASLNANLGDDVTTSGGGDVLVVATTGSITIGDGADADPFGISIDAGSILLRAGANITLDADVTTASGQIGVDAGNNIVQNADVTAANDVLLMAGNNLTMNTGTATTATGSNLLIDVGGSAALGLLTAASVSIEAGLDITNANGTTGNVIAITLRMIADSDSNGTGAIGGADLLAAPAVNTNAIYIAVDLLAASSADGIYLSETDDVIITAVADMAVSVNDVTRAFFNSSTDLVPALTQSHAPLSDLTTTDNGPIKLVSTNGSILATDGGDADSVSVSAHGSGDILLDAFANLLIDAAVESGTGNITLFAGGVLDANATITTSAADIILSALNLSIDVAITTGGGNLALLAAQDILQNVNITTAGGDVLVSAGGGFTMGGATAISTLGGNVLIVTGDAVNLARIDATSAGNVAIRADGDILDVNANNDLNIIADTLSMTASGTIGTSDLMNAVNVNDNAINTEINTLAAFGANGIYIQEVNDLVIDAVAAVAVNVAQVNFNSTTGNASELASGIEDLLADHGDIKIVTIDGSILVNDGANDDEIAISAAVAGDILLLAGGATRTITSTSGIESGAGSITIVASQAVSLGDDVATGGTGTIYIESLLAGVTIDDGADLDEFGLRSGQGDILVRGATDIVVNAVIESASGNIGLIAGGDISLSADVSGGQILINAAVNVNMTPTIAPDVVSVTSLTNGEIIIRATGDINLTRVDAGTGSVLLDAGGNIVDVNQDARLNVVAQQAAMIAGGRIGGPSMAALGPTVNPSAIDTSVDVLAAWSGTGIYVQEANGVEITDVNPFSIEIDVNIVNFNSTTTPLNESSSHAILSDLTTTINGPIKLLTLAGDIVANDGSLQPGVSVRADGTGDILLSAARDVLVNASVSSGTGHITLEAGDDIDVRAAVFTGGTGDVVLLAGNANAADAPVGSTDGITIAGSLNTSGGLIIVTSSGSIQVDAIVESASGSVALVANNAAGGDILINQLVRASNGAVLVNAAGGGITMAGPGEIDASTDVVVQSQGSLGLTFISGLNVALQSNAGNIFDNNAGLPNIAATNLSLRAMAGQIGASGLVGDGANANTNALDVQVTNLAAEALNGIYLLEVDGVTITEVAAVTIDLEASRVNFESTVADVNVAGTLAPLSDLTTTAGPIKLVSTGGHITITDGADADGGVVASGAANVLLDARVGSVFIAATVTTTGGNVTVLAGDDVELTGGADIFSNGGDIYVFAGNSLAGGGITLGADSSIVSGNQNIRLAADNEGDIVLRDVNAGSGSVSIVAEGSITQPTGLITAQTLRMWADANLNTDGSQSAALGNGVGSIGLAATPIDTAVNTLAAKAAGDIFVTENNGLSIAPTGDIDLAVVQFGLESDATAIDASLSDVESTVDGNEIGIIVSAGDLDIQSRVKAQAGLIGMSASSGSILQVVDPDPLVSNVIAGRLEVAAATAIHLSQTEVAQLSAVITSAVNSTHSDAALNLDANIAGTQVLNGLLTGGVLLDPDGLSLAGIASDFEFVSQFNDGYALFVRNTGDLTVVAAGLDPAISIEGPANPNLYLETRGGDLNIANGANPVDVSLTTTNNINPGVVLIAGEQLNVAGTIQTAATFVQTINTTDLNAVVFDGGDPPAPLGPPVSTQFVLSEFEVLPVTEDTHVLQQVVMQFGSIGESGFLSLIRYADAQVQLFDDGTELLTPDVAGPIGFRNGLDTAAMQREIAFTDAFLSQNFVLPTDVVVRRAMNFFLFSNADVPNNIVDEAAFRTTLENVFVSGVAGGFALPSTTPPNIVPAIFVPPAEVLPDLPVQPVPIEVELPAPTLEEIEVAIYQIEFNDINRDGQVDAAELPSYEEAAQVDEESVANRKVIKPAKAGATPTQEDIEREKNKLLSDPNQPSGAYAIIKRDPEGNITVLDVFMIRDWPEEKAAGTDEFAPVDDELLPKLPPFRPATPANADDRPTGGGGAEFVPPPAAENQPATDDSAATSSTHAPRSVTASSLLLGTLWIARRRQAEGSSATVPEAMSPIDEERLRPEVDFSRRARQRRRLHNHNGR